eukprot:scaffold8126_cov170-Amphora_coffeaeformis.AAC.15
MERTIRRIKENDPALTELDFSRLVPVAQESVEQFVEALAANQTITSVNLILRFLHKLQLGIDGVALTTPCDPHDDEPAKITVPHNSQYSLT